MSKKIELNIKTENGYEVLYPKTTPEMSGSLPLIGGTMQGPLILNRSPQENMEAVNKGYITQLENNIVGKAEQVGTYVIDVSNFLDYTSSSMNLTQILTYDQIELGCIYFGKIICNITLDESYNPSEGTISFCTSNTLNNKQNIISFSMDTESYGGSSKQLICECFLNSDDSNSIQKLQSFYYKNKMDYNNGQIREYKKGYLTVESNEKFYIGAYKTSRAAAISDASAQFILYKIKLLNL